MTWTNRRVLVTGAGGFIGSHLAERLVALGARTRGLVRYNSASSWGWLDASTVRDDIEVVAGDLRDADTVRRAVRGVDTIFHLASLVAIPYSYQAPLAFVRTNVEGTLNVCQAALDEGVTKLVHTSTSETYGSAITVPMDEQHSLRAQSPYAASKIGADKIAEAFHLSFGLPVAIIRPFNTYGPRQSARAVIPAIITQALTLDAIRLGSLEPARDFTYVSDTVEGFVRMAESPDTIGTVVNIGSGTQTAVSEMVALVLDLVGRKLPVECDGERVRPEASEVERLCADATRARVLLGWQPKVELREGLRRTIDWIASNLERYKIGAYTV